MRFLHSSRLAAAAFAAAFLFAGSVRADTSITCTLAAVGDTCTIDTQGMSTVGWRTAASGGTFTLVTELLYDGPSVPAASQVWFPAQVFDSNAAKNILIPANAQSATPGQFSQGLDNDPWITPVGGSQKYRARVIAISGGTVAFVMSASPAVNAAAVFQSNPNNMQVTASPPGAAAGQVTGTATGTTAGTTATLTASATTGQFTYLCGYSVSPGSATAAITIAITSTGLPNNLTDSVGAPVTAVGTTGIVQRQSFTPCLKGTPANTNITVVAGALGTGGVNQAVNAWGYTQ